MNKSEMLADRIKELSDKDKKKFATILTSSGDVSSFP